MSRIKERQKNKTAYILFATLSVLTVGCVVGIEYFKRETIPSGDKISVTLSGEGTTSERLQVENLALIPGGTAEYAVQISCAESGKYAVDMYFQETEDKGMAQFVDVQILLGEEIVAEDALYELLAGEKLRFQQAFTVETPIEYTVRYAIGEEKGNEVMGTSTSFNLIISAKKTQ